MLQQRIQIFISEDEHGTGGAAKERVRDIIRARRSAAAAVLGRGACRIQFVDCISENVPVRTILREEEVMLAGRTVSHNCTFWDERMVPLPKSAKVP